ncbi:5'-methylthioadenosine nucleosidase-like isoform X2 [Telopea speciosissima]|uniref:5'-methylthioadenosine nucleosidase-like isoform X2 n=1 Tax=Telopea speciosissima TaxID=54955 RepID=UPI001CC5BE96|nr:5'-methylthioadenosine nucleosidase-like isoform X2 [Telopea speciosissima]
MAPPEDGTEFTEEVKAAEAEKKPISTIVFVIAMQSEALPLVNRFQLTEDPDSLFPKGCPWVRYHGTYEDLHINLIWPGKDPVWGVDNVGTISASLVTYASIQALKPDLIVNAGTCGGFKAKGACIRDVFLVSEVAFHDRRIPIPVFDQYGVGARRTCSTPNLLQKLNLKGAAVAYAAGLFSVPTIFVKAVTDLVDGDKPTTEEFIENLGAVTAALDQTLANIMDFISGKCLSEL